MTTVSDAVGRPPRVPREHGAWAMLAIAPLVGLAVASRVTTSALAISAGLVLLFLARYAVLPAASRLASGATVASPYVARRGFWSAVYALASVAMLTVAVATAPEGSRSPVLLGAAVVGILGVLQCALALGRGPRSVAAELAGMAGLAAATPLIAFAAGASLPTRALGAGLLVFAYYLSSLLLVRDYKVHGEASTRILCIATQSLSLVGLILLWRLGWLPAAALLAFVPAVGRMLLSFAFPPKSIRGLGVRELGVGTLFVALAAGAFVL